MAKHFRVEGGKRSNEYCVQFLLSTTQSHQLDRFELIWYQEKPERKFVPVSGTDPFCSVYLFEVKYI